MTWGGEQALQAQAAVTFVLSGLGVPLYLLSGHRLELESVYISVSKMSPGVGEGGREIEIERQST